MYNMYMKHVSIAEARANLPTIIRQAKNEPVRVDRRGTPAAVIVPIEEYERLVGAQSTAWDAVSAWRQTVRRLKDHEDDIFDVRDTSTDGGRRFSWG